MTTTKLYLGIRGCDIHNGQYVVREIFRAAVEPTFATHGEKYNAVIGPFRTRRGAELMRDYGAGNPHYQTVADAERFARLELSAARVRR